MKRRNFLQSFGFVSGGILFSSPSSRYDNIQDFQQGTKHFNRGERFWQTIREQFMLPSDYAYFNTGGLGSSPFLVNNEVKKRMDQENIRPTAGHNMQDWWETKKKCATLLGPGCKKEEIALISSATEGINIILNGLPLKKGDEIITSSHEHVALNVPLLYKFKTIGVKIKTFEPDLKNGINNLKKIQSLISKNTRLIFISHITCTTGQIYPVEEIGELARSEGIWYALDGAQAIGQIRLDIKKTAANFYTASCHKWLLGPKRTGLLYVHRDNFDVLKPSIVGAYSEKKNDLNKRIILLQDHAQRFEYGTQNDALYYGLAKTVDFMQTIGIESVWKHNHSLSESFIKKCRNMDNIKLITPEEEKYRSSIVTFKVKGKNNQNICFQFSENGIRLRSVMENGLDAIRVSFHIYNNETEIKRFTKILEKI